jgi:hypothetical protein
VLKREARLSHNKSQYSVNGRFGLCITFVLTLYGISRKCLYVYAFEQPYTSPMQKYALMLMVMNSNNDDAQLPEL